MTSYVLGATGDGKANVVLVADADPGSFQFEQKRRPVQRRLETYAVVSARATGENVHREGPRAEPAAGGEAEAEGTWLPVVREVDLVPGVVQARLLVRDRESGRVGTVRHEFEVPPLHGLGLDSDPDGYASAGLRAQGPGRPFPWPVVRSRRGERCPTCSISMVRRATAGARRVSAGFEVHRAGGAAGRQPARPLAPTPRGPWGEVFVLSLRDVSPGDYEVVLRSATRGPGRRWRCGIRSGWWCRASSATGATP